MSAWVERERECSARPILPGEVEALEALGLALRSFRESAGLSRLGLATRSGLSLGHLEKLERGCRRTRLSTLGFLAAAIAGEDHTAGQAILDALVEAAGPTLVPANRFSVRREANRAKRAARAERLAAAAMPVAEAIAAEIVRDLLTGHELTPRPKRNRQLDGEPRPPAGYYRGKGSMG